MNGPMIQGPLFEVTVTEYERGWGQRLCPDETRIFTNASEKFLGNFIDEQSAKIAVENYWFKQHNTLEYDGEIGN